LVPDTSLPVRLEYEPALDGLRALAIAAVVLFHGFATSGFSGWVRGGGLGVSVFFTLSGFLISSLMLDQLADGGRLALGTFWMHRIRRLVPASLVVLALVVLGGAADWLSIRPGDVAAAAWSATNWHVIASGQSNLLRTIVGPLGPTWSLAVEEQFYLLLAVLFAWVGRRFVAVVCVAAVGASVLIATFASDWSPRLEFGTDVRAAELAVGVLLAIAIRRWPAWRRFTSTYDVAGWLCLAGTLALFAFADYQPPWLLRGGFALVAVVWAGLLLGALSHSSFAAVFGWRPLVAVGRMSYSVYLVHWPVFLVLSADRTGLHRWALLGVRLVAVAVVAVALHQFVERPVRQWSPKPRVAVGSWMVGSAGVCVLAVLLLD
jgi:peptidoglycan/LPS O-acetylase OafA/YrhL